MSAFDTPAPDSPAAPDGHPNFTSERKLLLGFALTLTIVIAVAGASFLGISRLRDDGQWIARTQEVIAALEDVQATATDAETAGRGYTITGDTLYLEPYRAAVQNMDAALDRLTRLIGNNPAQSQRSGKLAALVEQRMAVVHAVVEARRQAGFEAARALIAQGEGRRIHDAIRRLVLEMGDGEKALLQERLAKSEQSTRFALAAVSLGSLLSIGIGGLALYLIRRDFAGSRRAHAALQAANAELDRRVAERTAKLQEANARLELADAVFKNTQESIVITTPDSRIVAVNPAFCTVTEYGEDEVIGQSMRILSSGRQDPSFYQQMWNSIQTTGTWQGEIWNRRKSGDIYQEWLGISTVRDGEGKPAYYIGVAADLSRMNHAQTHLEYMAHHDALTGLPNRLLLHSRLEHTLSRAKRDNGLCAVLFLDLDRFKAVNDSLGHAAGDELLKLAAERMRGRLRDMDTLARLGGDEFVVVLESIASPDDAALVAGAMVEQLCAPFQLGGGHLVQVGTSVGISLYPRDAQNAAQLLDCADAALYAAKAAGRGTWRFAGAGAADAPSP